MDGSGRVTSRNRRYLRLLKNVSLSIPGLSEEHGYAKRADTRWTDPEPTTLPDRVNDAEYQSDPGEQEAFDDSYASGVEPTIPEYGTEADSVEDTTTVPQMPRMKLAQRRLQPPFNTSGPKDHTENIMPTRLRPRKTCGG